MVDLDGDGIQDILVSDLGSFPPTDRRCGSVVWLRGERDGSFTPFTILDGVGRVADAEAADFRGVEKQDLVVGVFGWQKTGEILYLENHSADRDHPKFEPRVLDDRHGTIHVPVCDLHGDGRKDFIALISQEHETVVAFLNDGKGNFEKQTIFTAAHPAYGSSGIQVVDFNGDGLPDVLYTNGDVLDKPYLLKPYHSVQWLENPGKGKFPWVHHPLAPMYGVHRAVAADLCGDGRLDVAAVCFLPEAGFPAAEGDEPGCVHRAATERGRPLRAAHAGIRDVRPRQLRRRRRLRDGEERYRGRPLRLGRRPAGADDLEEPRPVPGEIGIGNGRRAKSAPPSTAGLQAKAP